MSILFCSDTHFHHKNVIRYSSRPFSSVEEMNEALINNWNKVVNPGDTVYHLGDFALCSLTQLEKILARLNGEIHIITGNHDKVILQNQAGLIATNRLKSVQQYLEFKYNNYHIVLFHYQLEGDIKLPASTPDEDDGIKHDPIKACEDIIAAYNGGPEISYGGNKACYYPSLDKIAMPKMEQFEKAEQFYQTLFHEMSHSTGAKSRLDREGITDKTMFGDHKYSNEELVAELGATILCATVGIEKVVIENSAAYIKHWMGRLKNEKLLLFEAAQKAQRACDFIQGRSFNETEVEAEEAA